jgi:hypothetical protein
LIALVVVESEIGSALESEDPGAERQGDERRRNQMQGLHE